MPGPWDAHLPEELLADLGLNSVTQAIWVGRDDCTAAFEATAESDEEGYLR